MPRQLGKILSAKRAREATAMRIARREYCNDEIEIDSNAKFSDAEEEGIWVQAWVWVSQVEIDEENENTESDL